MTRSRSEAAAAAESEGGAGVGTATKRGLWLSVALCLCLAVVGIAAAFADEVPAASQPSADDPAGLHTGQVAELSEQKGGAVESSLAPDDAAPREAIGEADSIELQREANLETPAAIAEREASRYAYIDLGPAQEQVLLKEEFAAQLEAIDADPSRVL